MTTRRGLDEQKIADATREIIDFFKNRQDLTSIEKAAAARSAAAHFDSMMIAESHVLNLARILSS